MTEVLRPHGITQTQYNVLRILRGAGQEALCGREIAERLVSTVPDVPRLLDRMEACELVVRERSTSDRRYVTTRLSPKGAALLEEVTPALERVERTRMGSLEEETLDRLIAGLSEVRRCP
jgi:DNA-binding MarR family transcriptional regulator